MAITKRKPSIKTLKRKLDDVFSIYIRLRDSDSSGFCRCISCGKVQHWKDVDNGHYVNRSHMGTRYSERNCNAQCRSCNRFSEGNNIGYTRGLIRKYGIKVIDELDVKKHTQTYMKPFDYEVLIDHYKKEVEKLKADKNIIN